MIQQQLLFLRMEWRKAQQIKSIVCGVIGFNSFRVCIRDDMAIFWTKEENKLVGSVDYKNENVFLVNNHGYALFNCTSYFHWHHILDTHISNQAKYLEGVLMPQGQENTSNFDNNFLLLFLVLFQK